MSNAKRKGLEFTANQIGNAFEVIDNLIGDPSIPESLAVEFENNFIRIKGSTLYQDYDLSKKDPKQILDSEFNTFDITDLSKYALQGADFSIDKLLSDFSNFSSWNPRRYSPPCPEGWGIYDYNAWSNYIPQYNSSGIANTYYVIYDPFLEPSAGISRTQFEYPVRYTGTSSNYTRVPFFNFASWISIKNIGNSSTDELELIFPKSYLSGSSNYDPYNNCPKDLLFYSHRFLSSIGISDTISLDGTMGVMTVSDYLDILPYKIVESNGLGITNSSDKFYYKVNISTPSALSWNTNDWIHIAAYWGSHDSYIQDVKESYSPSSNKITIGASSENENFFFFPKKSFFNKNVFSSVGYIKSGVNDENIYLYAPNKSNVIFNEKTFVNSKTPLRYKINEEILNSSTGYTNSLLGLKILNLEEYLPIILAVKTKGNFYDSPDLQIEIFTGDVFTIEFSPSEWKDFNNYPKIGEDYSILAKIICKNSHEKNRLSKFTDNISYLVNDLSIVYIDMVASNVIKDSVADADLIYNFTSSFSRLVKSIRTNDYDSILSFIGQRLIARFSRYNLSKIFRANQFISLTSDEYKTLHNLSKLPYDTNLQQDNNEEPKAIQYSQSASNLISKFTQIPPSIEFAGLASSTLFLNDVKFDSNTEFEIYLSKFETDIKNENDNNQGTEKDYSFRIKFGNTDNQYTTKDIFVNASKYLLTDYDYDTRSKNKQSLDGYFKNSTLANIRDFKIYSYSGVIPDLKKEQYRKIENKQNQPHIFDRFTESEFENLQLSINPNLTKDQIISLKSGFGLTDSFYTLDSDKPSDSYNHVSNLGLTISNYSLNKNSYWIDNTKIFYGNNESTNIYKAKHIKDLRFDSFNIAYSGYTTSDNSINEIENIYDQRILSSLGSTINNDLSFGLQKILHNKYAFKIVCDSNQEVNSFKVKLKKNSSFNNENAKIKSFLYSDKNNSPFEKLAIGNEISLNDIDNDLKDQYFQINYSLFKNNIYWVVLEISQLPPLYDPYNYGLININDSNVTGILNLSDNSKPDFNRYLIGTELGIGSSIGSNITNWYEITSIGSTLSMTVASTGQTLTKQPYSIRYSFNIGIAETSSSNAEYNSAYYSSTGWTEYRGTPYIQFYKPEVEIQAAFNRNFEKSNINLPPPNKYRETDNYKVDEFWSFQCSEIENDRDLKIYPRSIKLNRLYILGSGVINTNKVSIASTNYNDKLLVGVGITGNYFSAGTSVTNIIYRSNDKEYDILLSSNILSSFANSSIGFGNTEYIYLKRAKDIYLTLKYNTSSGTFTTNLVLEKSPTWITQWYSKSKNNYFKFDDSTKANIITSTFDLNFNAFEVGESNYINGISSANFKVLASLGTTFDFRFISSGGLRVKVDNESSYSIDKWQTSSSTGFTFSKILESVNSLIKFDVYFNNLSSSVGQTIIGQWRKTGETSWNIINDNFYEDLLPQPIDITDKKIKNISFMTIGKNDEIYNYSNLGQPFNDRLIIRSN